MAGAAGGALQTAQRIGSPIGAAGLVTMYYRSLTGSGKDYAAAVSEALLAGIGFLLALLMALVAATRRTAASTKGSAVLVDAPQRCEGGVVDWLARG